VKDAKGRGRDHPKYDPNTISIPALEFTKFTPAMQQYWKIKKENFDKIIFFKLGKFYEIFYQDAILCHKLLDLNWMSELSKLHVGFPERSLDKYLEALVNKGLQVAVIEQTSEKPQS